MDNRNQKINLLTYKVTKGDEAAFETVFFMYYPRLQKYAQSILHDSQEAEDLVQDVFIQIWNNREILDDKLCFSSYVFTLVKNRCLNAIKKKVVESNFVKHQIDFKTEELYHISFDGDDNFISIQEQLKIEIEKVMQKMPARCQTAFRLKWLEGKKIREIAELMNISTTMVDKHLAKGIQIARENLAPDMFLFFVILNKIKQ